MPCAIQGGGGGRQRGHGDGVGGADGQCVWHWQRLRARGFELHGGSVERERQ